MKNETFFLRWWREWEAETNGGARVEKRRVSGKQPEGQGEKVGEVLLINSI